MMENNLIEKYTIFKKCSSSLEISIDKTKFLANIIKNEKIILLDQMEDLLKQRKAIMKFYFWKFRYERISLFKRIIKFFKSKL